MLDAYKPAVSGTQRGWLECGFLMGSMTPESKFGNDDFYNVVTAIPSRNDAQERSDSANAKNHFQQGVNT